MDQDNMTQSFTLQTLANHINATIICHDKNLTIHKLSSFKTADNQSLCLFHQKKYLDELQNSLCKTYLIPPHLIDIIPPGKNLLIHENPYKAFALLSRLFHPESAPYDFRAPTAFIAQSAKIGKNCFIAHGAFIGENTIIGNHCKIGVNCYIGNNVTMGDNCQIENLASVTNAHLGDFVKIHPGARIGQDGFGFASDAEGHYTIHHQGKVIIGNHVSIGSNTCVDRGTLDNTEIADHVRLDNLIQIGHNVKIGKGTVIAAQTGIAGSTTIGKNVILAGQIGINGHITIENFASVCGKSQVTKNIPEGARYAGYPATKDIDWNRQVATLKKLSKK